MIEGLQVKQEVSLEVALNFALQTLKDLIQGREKIVTFNGDPSVG